MSQDIAKVRHCTKQSTGFKPPAHISGILKSGIVNIRRFTAKKDVRNFNQLLLLHNCRKFITFASITAKRPWACPDSRWQEERKL